MSDDSLVKYNVFKENDIEMSIINNTSKISFYNERSTIIRQSGTPPSKIHFNFLITSAFRQVKIFFITIVKKRFPNIYYGFDSTAFCLLKYSKRLVQNRRYIVYGTLSKNKLYFIDCLKADEIDYKKLCYMLL